MRNSSFVSGSKFAGGDVSPAEHDAHVDRGRSSQVVVGGSVAGILAGPAELVEHPLDESESLVVRYPGVFLGEDVGSEPEAVPVGEDRASQYGPEVSAEDPL